MRVILTILWNLMSMKFHFRKSSLYERSYAQYLVFLCTILGTRKNANELYFKWMEPLVEYISVVLIHDRTIFVFQRLYTTN